MIEVCEHDKCTGCEMCVNICPKNAISMVSDKHGFRYPQIDSLKCVDCKLCEGKCPSNSEISRESTINNVYAAWNKNSKQRKESTSGGIFSLLAEHVIFNGGVVVGASWTKDFDVQHIIIDNIKDLSKLRGSKYLQSNIGSIYKEVKKYLDNDKLVLFSGTPCQNNALRVFLNKDYNNLYQVDVICHGVPSYEVFKKHLDELTDNGKKKINSIRLRHKNPFWNYSNVTIEYDNAETYSVSTTENSYFNLFNFGYSLRTSCSQCQYTSQHRYSDITLADFWGFTPQEFKMVNYNKGVSCIIINSEKGDELFKLISSHLVYEKRTIEQAVSGNKSLKEPYNLPGKEIKSFWIDYDNGMLISDLNKKYITHPFKKPSLIRLRVLKNQIKGILKI